MASAINRTTLEFLDAVNTPDFSASDWIINPDLSQVAKLPKKYWLVKGDAIVPMDAQAQAAVDAAELASTKAQAISSLLGVFRDYVDARYAAYSLHVIIPGNPDVLDYLTSIYQYQQTITTLISNATKIGEIGQILGVVDITGNSLPQPKIK